MGMVFIENPPVDKSLRKRKREENEEERTRKFFTRSADLVLENAFENENEAEDENKSSTDDNRDDEDDEMPSEKFRRGLLFLHEIISASDLLRCSF